MYLYIDSREKRLGRQGKGVKGEGYGDMVKKQPVLVQYSNIMSAFYHLLSI